MFSSYIIVTNVLIFLLFSKASKGIGANMLKCGTKRRRTKAAISAEKEEALIREQSANDFNQNTQVL